MSTFQIPSDAIPLSVLISWYEWMRDQEDPGVRAREDLLLHEAMNAD